MRLAWFATAMLLGCSAGSPPTMTCGAPAGSPPFYSCLCGSDCQSGHYCVGVPGRTAYCRPPCSASSDCASWTSTYPNLDCETIPARSGGSVRVCADNNHDPADVAIGVGGSTPRDAGGSDGGASTSCGSFAACGTPQCERNHRACASAGGGPFCCMGICNYQYCDCDGDRVSCETFVGDGTCPPGSPGRC